MIECDWQSAVIAIINAIVLGYLTIITRRNENKVDFTRAVVEKQHPDTATEVRELMNGKAPDPLTPKGQT